MPRRNYKPGGVRLIDAKQYEITPLPRRAPNIHEWLGAMRLRVEAIQNYPGKRHARAFKQLDRIQRVVVWKPHSDAEHRHNMQLLTILKRKFGRNLAVMERVSRRCNATSHSGS